MLPFIYTLWSFFLLLLPIATGVITEFSVWVLVFSLYISYLTNPVLEEKLSEEFGFKTSSKIFQRWEDKLSTWIFLSLLLTVVSVPIIIYISLNDNTSIISNSLLVFLWSFSFNLLNLIISPDWVKLFSFPWFNPSNQAKKYTITNFLGVLWQSIWELIVKIAKKSNNARMISFWRWLYQKSEYLNFPPLRIPENILLYSIIALLSLTIIFSWWEIFYKLTDSDNLILWSIFTWVFLLTYSIIWGILDLPDRIAEIIWSIQENWFQATDFTPLRDIFTDTIFLKILILVFIFITFSTHWMVILDNYWLVLEEGYNIFKELFTWDDFILTRIWTFLKDLLRYIFF